MGKIIVSENVTVDGGVRDPTGEEGTPGGGWFNQAGPADREAFGRAALEEALAADAFLMGRRTYEFLASRWPARTGALADRLNDIAKYVVSATLATPAWNNVTVLRGGDPGAQVTALSGQIEGDIIVPASFRLVRTLLEQDLVDELRVMVFPVILGAGDSLLGQLTDSVPVRLLVQRRLGEQLTYSAYEIVRG
jgi:dihydrofolate reductase